MAQVARTPDVHARVDYYLDYLLREWQEVRSVAQDWDSWDEDDRLDFALEWPIREDRLGQLQEWAAQGILTPTQRARYDELLQLVRDNRPAIEELLRDELA